jgi:Rieske Fe-S protein
MSDNLERRSFLRQGFMLGAAAALAYPFFKFLFFHVPRKPRHVKVDKLLKDGEVFIDPDFILFAGDKKLWAVSRKCTHLGCRLNYSEKDHLLICPCHQSRFAVDGKKIAGPARKNLDKFPVEVIAEAGKSGYIVTI